jgi:hypothetical protein
MRNRIGRHFDHDLARVERAAVTIQFCDAIGRIHVQSGDRTPDTFNKLACMIREAIKVFNELGVPIPDQLA